MKLCLACARVGDHTAWCIERPAPVTDRILRTKNAMAEVERALEAMKALAPRAALLQVLEAEDLLGKNPSRFLQAFDQKRAHANLETRLSEAKKGLQEQAERGAELIESFPAAKQAIEIAFAYHGCVHESARLDTSALEGLAILRVESAGRALKEICSAVERRLEETKHLDRRVAAWGWNNLTAIVTCGPPPEDVPAEKRAKGLTGYLGNLVGRGNTNKGGTATEWKLLSDEFRDRLYLLGANMVLMRHSSRLAQTHDAWKRHMGAGSGLERWQKIKAEAPDLVAFFLPEPAPEGTDADDWIKTLAERAAERRSAHLRPPSELGSLEWDVLAKAYFIVFAAIMAGQSSLDVGLESVSRTILERSEQPASDDVLEIFENVRNAWLTRPPRDLPPSR